MNLSNKATNLKPGAESASQRRVVPHSSTLRRVFYRENRAMETYAQQADEAVGRAMRLQKRAKKLLNKGLTKKAHELTEKADAIFSRF